MGPDEIAAANILVSTHVANPGQELIVTAIKVPSVVIVLPLPHAEALSACANVGLEGADRAIGDLTWAAVSKLDEVVREAKAATVDDDVVDAGVVDEPEPFDGGPGDEPGPAGGGDDELAHKRMDDARAAALDDPRR